MFGATTTDDSSVRNCPNARAGVGIEQVRRVLREGREAAIGRLDRERQIEGRSSSLDLNELGLDVAEVAHAITFGDELQAAVVVRVRSRLLKRERRLEAQRHHVSYMDEVLRDEHEGMFVPQRAKRRSPDPTEPNTKREFSIDMAAHRQQVDEVADRVFRRSSAPASRRADDKILLPGDSETKVPGRPPGAQCGATCRWNAQIRSTTARARHRSGQRRTRLDTRAVRDAVGRREAQAVRRRATYRASTRS